jgi:hypothetical protein
MAGGRPQIYTKKLQGIADAYVEDCTAFEDVVPTVAGLSLALGITRETVYAWAKATVKTGGGEVLQYPEFSDTISKLQAKQERELIANGLQSVFNPAITRLMLSSNHGYKERTDHTSKDEKLPSPILNAIPSDDSTKED